MKLVKIKCGEKMGCVFDDEIIISISPAMAADLMGEYQARAFRTDDYCIQGLFRKRCDFFEDCYSEWEDKREKLSE